MVILCTPVGKGKRGSRCGRPTFPEFNQRPDVWRQTKRDLGMTTEKESTRETRQKSRRKLKETVVVLVVYTNKVTRKKKNVDVDKRATKTLTATNRPGVGGVACFCCVGASAEQHVNATAIDAISSFLWAHTFAIVDKFVLFSQKFRYLHSSRMALTLEKNNNKTINDDKLNEKPKRFQWYNNYYDDSDDGET